MGSADATADVLEALDRRHPEAEGEWVVLREALGIDALVFRCWQGDRDVAPYRRIAYEVKASRGDFRREIKRPSKRAYAESVVDQFFFAAPKGLIRAHEIPGGCGLVEIADDLSSRLVVKAPILQPRGFTRREVAALLRYRMLPSKQRAVSQRLANQVRLTDHLQGSLERQQEALGRAEGRLVALVGHTVAPGTRWRGPWRSWAFRRTPVMATGVVDAVREYETGERWVELRPEDRMPESFYGALSLRVGEFLRDFEPVDGRAAA